MAAAPTVKLPVQIPFVKYASQSRRQRRRADPDIVRVIPDTGFQVAAVKAHRKLVVAIGWRNKYGGQIGAEDLRANLSEDTKIKGANFLSADEQMRRSRIAVDPAAFILRGDVRRYLSKSRRLAGSLAA